MTTTPDHNSLLAVVRRRPWLAPYIGVLIIGPSLMANNSSRSLVFWMGAVSIALGVLGVLLSEASYRKNRRA
jgi:hypothetical protein